MNNSMNNPMTIAIQSEDFTTRLHEEDRTENILHSCCFGSSDKRLITILSQVIFSATIIIFSCSMLALNPESDNEAIYVSLITSVLGYWLGKNEDQP